MNRRFVKAVGALNAKEVESILICSGELQVCCIVDLAIYRKFPEKFLWKDDTVLMAAFADASTSGPYNFVVLVFV